MHFKEFMNGLTATFSVKALSKVAERMLKTSLCLGASNGTMGYRPASVIEEAKRKSWEK